ncbi:prepilin-type N-terminal cleavage/methylation domain-containing protein [bacterium]|nr:MAG: prepilin-type N-terminal cleavage/methylation domain-containing protein [bacterium]
MRSLLEHSMSKKAFTLIELLVVIAIIAILAAILFPVFAQAKLAAKKSADLSNTKQQGTALQIYLGDSDDTYPSAYYYPDDNSSANGYVHWSGVLLPYIKSQEIFVSPGDALGGMAPTNYSTTTNNRGKGAPGGQTPQTNADIDVQAPRISYVANAAIMPRKRKTADPANVVSATAVDGVSQTIVIGPLTSTVSCINGTSSASGQAFKSHRPANAFMLDAGGATPFVGEAPAEYTQTAYYTITADQAAQALVDCRATPGNYSHITYAAPYRFGGSNATVADVKKGGGNYVFADTSAKFLALPATLNPQNYRWGKSAYGAGGKAILDPITGLQVQ